jgi:hypothetical protein
MAKTILRDAYVAVNGVDISDHVDTVELNFTWPNLDVTGMGAAFKERLLGIADASAKCTLFQDFATGEIHDTLHNVAGSNTPSTLVIRPVKTGGVSSTNPNITMQVVMDAYDPVRGKVGEPSMIDVTFWNATQTGPVYSET